MSAELTENQIELYTEVCERGSVQLLQHCVKNKVLADFQTVCVAISLITEKQLISLDTGLGKTLVATGLINILCKKYPGLKWIYLCQNSNLKTTHDKLQDGLFSAKAVWTGGDKRSVSKTFFKEDALSADVLVLSYNVLENKFVNDFLFRNRSLFRGVILDESQTIGNNDSYTFRLVDGILKNARFAYLLSATPLRIEPEQICNQVAIMDRDKYGYMIKPSFMRKYHLIRDGEVIGYQNLDELEGILSLACFSVTRKMLGAKGHYKVKVLWADSKPEYRKVKKMDSFNEILGDPTGPALTELVRLCCQKVLEEKQGLVYVNRTSNKLLVKERLESKGLRVGVMDGTITNTQKKKEAVHLQYINKELDVLITNVSTGKDLPSDYICFYELTFDFKQMLGRGERGLKGKDMEIYFILIKGTPLIDYFYHNVYERGVFLEEILSKDIQELKDAYNQVSEECLGTIE